MIIKDKLSGRLGAFGIAGGVSIALLCLAPALLIAVGFAGVMADAGWLVLMQIALIVAAARYFWSSRKAAK